MLIGTLLHYGNDLKLIVIISKYAALHMLYCSSKQGEQMELVYFEITPSHPLLKHANSSNTDTMIGFT